MNPLRSEEDAFRVTIVIAILAAPVALAALVFDAGVALGVVGGLAFAGLFALVRNRQRPEVVGADVGRRILLVANESLSGRALRDEVAHRAKGATPAQVSVICPALDDAGPDVQGDVGSDDPVQAIEDALRTFPADEVIVSTYPLSRSNWLEAGVVARARARFDVPVTHVVVDLASEGESVVLRDQGR